MSRPPPNGYRNMSNGSNPTLNMSSSNSALNSQSRLGTPNMSQQQRPSSSGVSRAERFEDEKRRIIESCFSKVDANGQLSESYITHIRIQEDAAHPSSPPPPESPPGNRKPRLIIIAVRSTGRVRMHKARENNNGSFSIGKTWNLEELSAIESFSNSALPPKDEREEQYRSWAGGLGFIVTITKPYYWQAGTSKEKDFFIASAVKIYRKYTKGLVPELRGFDEQNQAAMLGAPPGQQPQGPPAPSPRLPSGDMAAPSPPQPPFASQGSRPSSREDPRMRGSPGPPPGRSSQRHAESPARPPQPPYGQPGRPGQPSPVPRSQPSSERMRSKSREPSRPGTQTGPPAPAQNRTPHSSSSHPSGPSQQRSQSRLRSDSPAISAASSGSREAVPQARKPRSQSPPKQQVFDRSTNNGIPDRTREASQPETNGAPAGAAAGAALLANTRQRWQQQQQQQQPPLQPQNIQQQPDLQRERSPAHRKQPSTSQLPPLETTHSNRSRSQQPQQDERQNQAQQTRAPTGVDPIDVTASSGMNSQSAAEPSTPAVDTTPTQQPGSPQTPERSKRRPQFDTRASEHSVDLRPPPLKQAGKPTDGGSSYATPSVGSVAGTPKERSAVSTPAREEPPDVKPLAVQKPSETNIAMPGAFESSPQSTPADTPSIEKEQKDVEPTPEPATEPTTNPDPEPESEEAFRPGLGPMVKKRPGAADRFRKAAFAANAFKPRPGGAAERIMKAKAEKEAGGASGTSEADGITGVFRAQKEEPTPAPAPEPEPAPAPPAPKSPQSKPVSSDAPKLAVTSPVSPLRMPSSTMRGDGTQLTDGGPVQAPEQAVDAEALQPEVPSKDELTSEDKLLQQSQLKVKRRSLQQERYLVELGIDKSLLEGKGLEFESLLADFGWGNGARQPRPIADFESDVKRQLGRVEAGSWLSQNDTAREEKVSHVEGLLDKAIAECDELEGLLTLYSVELGSLNEDIRYIEAQSQGLQVQSANQQLLHTELTHLIGTISLDRSVLEPLRYSDIADPAGLEDVELSLVKLYQALVTMDPMVKSTGLRPKSRLGDDGLELSRMAALREKKNMYERESNTFCQRLMQHLDFAVTSNLNGAKGQTMKPVGDGSLSRLNKDAFTAARTGLWVYSPLLLFSKELNMPAWQTMLRMYNSKAKPLYGDSFKENIAGWKRAARKPTGEEAELLFTHVEKETADGSGSGLGSTARKITIKRSQTLAKSLRSASGEKKSASESRNQGSLLMACEVFAGAMDEMAPLINQEQNFIVDFFHATSLETSDFVDVVSSTPPERRRGTNLLAPKPMDPDREMARRVTGAMEELFSFFSQEMSILVDWAVSADPIQGVGVLAALSKHAFFLTDTAQEYLLQLIEQLNMRLQTSFAKFVDDQIRAIEETKVKIHKRKGVIAFMRIFPQFSAAVENVFAAVARADYDGPSESVAEVRRLVDDAYSRINRSMFDSLKVIAKESPVAGAPAGVHNAAARQGGVDDPEDKEMLNYHVLLIENMNHYIEEVDDGGREGVLAEWRGRAMMERQEALEAYVGRVVRRPLGKLLVSDLDPLHISKTTLTNITGLPRLSRLPAGLVPEQPHFYRHARLVLPQDSPPPARRLQLQGSPQGHRHVAPPHRKALRRRRRRERKHLPQPSRICLQGGRALVRIHAGEGREADVRRLPEYGGREERGCGFLERGREEWVQEVAREKGARDGDGLLVFSYIRVFGALLSFSRERTRRDLVLYRSSTFEMKRHLIQFLG